MEDVAGDGELTVTKTEERHSWSGSRVSVMESPSGRHKGRGF